MEKPLVELGDLVKDRVTGFKGIAIGKTLWMSGCWRITVQPQGLTKDGKAFESNGYDDNQLELVKRAAVPSINRDEVSLRKVGGPQPEPRQRP